MRRAFEALLEAVVDQTERLLLCQQAERFQAHLVDCLHLEQSSHKEVPCLEGTLPTVRGWIQSDAPVSPLRSADTAHA